MVDFSICCTWQAARSAPRQIVNHQDHTAICRSTTTASVLDNACIRSARSYPLRLHGGERADGNGASQDGSPVWFNEIGGSAAAALLVPPGRCSPSHLDLLNISRLLLQSIHRVFFVRGFVLCTGHTQCHAASGGLGCLFLLIQHLLRRAPRSRNRLHSEWGDPVRSTSEPLRFIV